MIERCGVCEDLAAEIARLKIALALRTRERDDLHIENDRLQKSFVDLNIDSQRLAAVVAEANRLTNGASSAIDGPGHDSDDGCTDCAYSEGILHAAERLRDKAAGL